MMTLRDNTRIFILFTIYTLCTSIEDASSKIEDFGAPSRILSRQKRFLIFPDGSSFQLVFCEQNHGYLQIGDIVWFGNTAALAWELPTDPKYITLIKSHEKNLIHNRNGVSKNIYLLDEDGKVLSKIPYHKKFIVNPAFAKRSIDETHDKPISIKRMHEKQKNVSYLTDLDSSSIEFHREGRKDFYLKLEGFLKALGFSGQECVSRMLCETGQGNPEQGTFFEEIMRATFTFPRGKKSEYHRYDKAHNTRNKCSSMYPACELVKSSLR